MPVEYLEIGEPFFGLRHVTDEAAFQLEGRAIVLNLGTDCVFVEDQRLAPLQSTILESCMISEIEKLIIIDRFDAHDDDVELMTRIRDKWPSAFEVRGEERLRGVEHYMSPKTWVDRIGFTIYHSASIPLNVGLHKEHPFCPVPGFREVHTQIVGFGKMQQCREKDLSTLYLEEVMAPGHTHRPMFDADGNYPWHQFETITPSVFMAVEMLPEGAQVPV
ncbi:MAG: hypothetical protein JJ866_10885 [Roseibium sp.]|uniref:hypothetical protein n=1 Tax=Roseibium sp. TaxID=1936156 RepID=UPI001B0032AC|nr:hypothetical protein [Roseibium sp.]MBO6892434.1 hypothetical protein [Roseibium sp.]MBO6928700.1 hypothetical protein [Roseibium sp.]